MRLPEFPRYNVRRWLRVAAIVLLLVSAVGALALRSCGEAAAASKVTKERG